MPLPPLLLPITAERANKAKWNERKRGRKNEEQRV